MRLAIGLFFLIIASAQDLRKRRVDDIVWVVMGTLGIILIIIQLILDNAQLEYYLVLVPILVLFFDIFWDREPLYEDGEIRFVPLPILFYVIAFLVIIWLFVTFNTDHYFLKLFTVPVMILISYGLYYSGLIKGGADAKALICIAILVPLYPILNGFPLIGLEGQFLDITSILFPFALVVLMNASILFLFSPLVFLSYNIKRGSVEFPQCFFGYRVSINSVPRFTWLMQKIEDGEVVLRLFPRRSDDKKENLRELKKSGQKEVWVTPQIPFIVPLCLGFLISFLIGNLFLGLLLLIT
jgi:preflagellin peptidase FlaK